LTTVPVMYKALTTHTPSLMPEEEKKEEEENTRTTRNTHGLYPPTLSSHATHATQCC
jgi:hypothetical protein